MQNYEYRILRLAELLVGKTCINRLFWNVWVRFQNLTHRLPFRQFFQDEFYCNAGSLYNWFAQHYFRIWDYVFFPICLHNRYYNTTNLINSFLIAISIFIGFVNLVAHKMGFVMPFAKHIIKQIKTLFVCNVNQ